MEKQRLTRWFPATFAPTRVGVYERRIRFRGNPKIYAYWNGQQWHAWCWTVKRAYDAHTDGLISMDQSRAWRGLAFDPKGK